MTAPLAATQPAQADEWQWDDTPAVGSYESKPVAGWFPDESTSAAHAELGKAAQVASTGVTATPPDQLILAESYEWQWD
ncbi:hypothetical protein Rhe02_23320 [Rhizocola hellebori]|uniref:Uncharacterized protein n=1 Tax=Rhizocola hellebori TaxID=1392758 RepID=A0A8J3Q6Z3_9ACTN|nr:hypothetical protein [Rhizocola hellebori]GIH04265.1 hypothetical protein Rhe02_23320 [Rhizocola hellebori]